MAQRLVLLEREKGQRLAAPLGVGRERGRRGRLGERYTGSGRLA